MLLSATALLFAEDSFSLLEGPYTMTQNIAYKLIAKNNVYVRLPSKRELTWHVSIRNMLNEAKKFRSNTVRLNEMNKLCEMISAEFNAEYEGTDKNLPDIAKNCIEPAIGRSDLMWAMVLTVNLNNYVERYVLKNISDNEAIKEEMNNINNVMKNACQDRFNNDDLKKLADDFKKLFPDKKLIFDYAPPSNFNECADLINKNLQAYQNLDKYSAVAEFADWGQNMLDFLILSYEPMFIKEFEERLAAYKKNFKTK